MQGVGFRPFVYRLAKELNLKGWVINSAQGVFVEVEGLPNELSHFARRLRTEKPARAIVQSCEASQLEALGYDQFEIRESTDEGGKSALILPDIATCGDCLREIFSPNDRRFRYPFTNCTNCGPRFSIIEALPYDRANTSMKKFAMCDECAREYRDPADRRFHAEPVACPRCGPQLQLWNSLGITIAQNDDALLQAAEEIRAGRIVALKGLGGFQLLVDARNDAAVRRLREQKHREEKPFALMYPSLEAIAVDCDLEDRHPAGLGGQVSSLPEQTGDGLEARRPSQAGSLTSVSQLLLSPESPIVLLKKLPSTPNDLAGSIAPGNPNLGVMLPYTPLHHLLLRELNFPVVATSGNLSDEPICIDEHEALERLGSIADCFLVHDRPIIRHVDDSVVRLMAGREMMLRRARGYAPLPIALASRMENRESRIVLAVGAHLKNTVALNIGSDVFVSQHIGDLATKPAHDAFMRSTADLPRLYEAEPDVIAHDLHPEYLSTRFALQQPGQKVAVQHHWAHIVACMAENEIAPPALGVSWDGTGYGLDDTIWGGEFLRARNDGNFERAAYLRPFRLPGGEQAIKEPRRCALGLLHEMFGEKLWRKPRYLKAFAPNELRVLRQMLARKVNAPLTSSAGRLFDAVAALIGLRQRTSFEGQAAMELEFAANDFAASPYSFHLSGQAPIVIDWEPAIRALLSDIESGTSPGEISAKFHHMLSKIILATADRSGEPKVILSGGCFQNRYLTELVIADLRAAGFEPVWHQWIPPNDGGISLGQAVAASWREPEATES